MHTRKKASLKNQIKKGLTFSGVLAMLVGMTGIWKPTCVTAQTVDTISSTYADEVGQYGMLPVYAVDIEPGTYAVDAQTNSRYFRIHDPQLTVYEDLHMEVTFYLESTSYSHVYQGTKDAALQAGDEEKISAKVKDGYSYFTLPVSALNAAVDCAAFSVSKQRWYDRQLLFEASSLPAEALHIELPDYDLIERALEVYENGAAESEKEEKTKIILMGSQKTGQEETEALISENGTEASASPDQSAMIDSPTAVAMDMVDGAYSVEVILTGGSGRASVSSPTYFYVKEGLGYATLLWSSTHYDYMILDGKTYYNESVDGGISRFTIPVTAFDEPIAVIADTTAMGEPVEIEYTLTFYRDSIGNTGLIPQEAAKRVLIMAVIIITVGAAINYIVKKRTH